jgi:hypothetical protein
MLSGTFGIRNSPIMSTDNNPSKAEWLPALYQTHEALIHYVNLLPDEALVYSQAGKWSAGQQLQHVYLCLLTISKALSSKKYVEETFGRIDRPTLSYDEVIERYKAGLAAGGKAPDRFVPGPFEPGQKEATIANLRQTLQDIETHLQAYTEEDCNTLILPHPFIGKLTIKELLFLMTEHASVHQRSIEHALQQASQSA